MSQSIIPAGDVGGLLKRLGDLKRQTRDRVTADFPIITIQEAGMDGFWLHRVLIDEGIESHVVDPASVAVSRRKRRAKTDKIDGEALVRTLLAFKRGEPRVCSMVVAPTPDDEDQENQLGTLSQQARFRDLDLIRAQPYRPAASKCCNQRPYRSALSLTYPCWSKPSCTAGGNHRRCP